MSLNTGLIAHYRMNNISDNTLIDEMGNYDGTISATGVTPNEFGLLFSNGYVSVGSLASSITDTVYISTSFIVNNVPTSNIEVIIGLQDSVGSRYNILVAIDTDSTLKFYFTYSDGSQAIFNTTETFSTGVEVDLVFGLSNGSYKVFIDSIESYTGSGTTGNIGGDDLNLQIARDITNIRFLNGTVGCTRIYNRALLQVDVDTLYNNKISPSGTKNYNENATTDSIAVTSDENWTATSSDSWVTITSGSSGSGNGTINYSVDALSDIQSAGRTATITVAFDSLEQTLVINQSDGKVLYYTGSNVSGSTLIDENSNFDATINGAVPVNCGISYDGVNDYTLVSDYDSRLVFPQATVISRFKINSLPASEARFFNNLLFTEASGSTANSGFLLSINSSGNPSIAYIMLNSESYSNDDSYSTTSYVAANVSLSTTLSTDTWYTLAATIDNNTSKLYLDGALLCTLTTTQPIRYSSEGSSSGRLPTTSMGAGRYEGNTLIFLPFDGVISNTVLYDMVLSDAKILEWSNLSDVTLSGNTSILGDAGSDTVTVSTEIACWEASSNVGWLTIDSPASTVKGAGTINYSYTENTTGSDRDAIITVTGGNDIEQLIITQSADEEPIEISPSGNITIESDSGTGEINVTVSSPSINWTATSNEPWLTITSGASGSGNGTIEYSVQDNISGRRFAIITVEAFGYITQLIIYQAQGLNKTSSLFYRMFKHLLPRAKAWRLRDNTALSKFIYGISSIGFDSRNFFDLIFSDIDPQKTRELPKWESQFNLTNSNLTEQQRRDRLEATWASSGGQDPYYIQETLQAAGFDVYVHGWWEPGTEPAINSSAAATPRNPLTYLKQEGVTIYNAICGDTDTVCGGADALCGNSDDPLGYALVNKVYRSELNYNAICGDTDTVCGGADALCGNYDGFRENLLPYSIPTEPKYWSYFLYIGAETFPNVAQIPLARKNEFEELCLKICPTQQWLCMLINYN